MSARERWAMLGCYLIMVAGFVLICTAPWIAAAMP
jgi:hypothetical protein